MSVRLGELLTKAGLISQDQLKDALKTQKETGGKLGETLIKLGFVAEDDIKFMTGYNVEPVVASELGIKAAIDNYYGSTSSLELKKVMEDLQQSESADLEVLEEGDEFDIAALAEG